MRADASSFGRVSLALSFAKSAQNPKRDGGKNLDSQPIEYQLRRSRARALTLSTLFSAHASREYLTHFAADGTKIVRLLTSPGIV